jgi:hypothetical protein
MTETQLATTLTTLAQFKAPYLAVIIKRDGSFYCGQVIARHRGKTIAQFGNRLRPTLPELKRALCDYLTIELRILPDKQQMIEDEITRLDDKARKATMKKQTLICDKCGAENWNLASEGKSHDRPADEIKGYDACDGVWRRPQAKAKVIKFRSARNHRSNNYVHKSQTRAGSPGQQPTV